MLDTLDGAYAGHPVHHRDLVPLHAEQVAAAAHPSVDTDVAKARDLDLPEASMDAVLVMGRLYHLHDRDDLVTAPREARSIARPGAPVLVSAISRWAPRPHGYRCDRLYRRHPWMADVVARAEDDGTAATTDDRRIHRVLPHPGRPALRSHHRRVPVEDLVSVDGLALPARPRRAPGEPSQSARRHGLCRSHRGSFPYWSGSARTCS